jgi:probable HAF family extracellular repeat protein
MTQDQVQAQSTPPRSSTIGENSFTRVRETGIKQMKSGLLLTAATAAILLTMGHSARAAWDFVTLQDPGAVSTVASGVNDSGQIVGYFVDSSLNTNGFGYSGGSYTTIDVPGAAATTASGISNSGEIIGSYTDSSGGVHGFTQSGFGGTATSFDDPSGVGNTNGSGVNSSGTTVGYYYDGTTTHGFTANGGIYTTLDAPGATTTNALGVNGLGTVVGSFFNGTTNLGFVESGGHYTVVNDPFGVEGTVATGIDNHGDIVGYYTDGGGVTHGFVDLNGTYYNVDDPNAGSSLGEGTVVLGIDPALTVVGYYIDGSGVISGFSAEVPEPATIALFGLGVLGAVRLRRRRVLAA